MPCTEISAKQQYVKEVTARILGALDYIIMDCSPERYAEATGTLEKLIESEVIGYD